MRFVKFLSAVVCIFMLVLLAGCAKAPQELVDTAKAALDAAKAVEADRYVADQFNAAQDSLNAAMAEIEAQGSKFALTRNYGRATKLLEATVATANSAKDAAAAAKEQVRVEAQDLMTQAQAAVEEAKGLMAKAPRGKEGRAVLEQMQSELAAVETSITEATTAMSNNDFLTARDKLKAGMEKANSISEELKQAIGKKTALSKKS
jgi:hypothetical protein